MNYIYKTRLLHYLLFLVVYTQFIFHTSKNLNTLVKTFMLITVGLFFLCMENVSFFQPCILRLKQKIDPRSYFIVQGEPETPRGF